MPYNGSGVFNPLITFVPNTSATAEDQNSQDVDIAAGLTDCMTRDGQAPALANISMGGFLIKNLGPGVANTDAANYGQVLSSLIPTGVTLPFAGSTVPTGYLLCYGQAVSRTAYAALYAVIGVTYGTGDGTTTFNLPNLNGRLIAGADNMGGTPANVLTGYDLGVSGGEQTHTLVTGEIPSHNHSDSGHTHVVSDPGHHHSSLTTYFLGNPGSGGPIAGGGTFTYQLSATTQTASTGITNNTGYAAIQNTGGGGSHNNIQPTLAMNYIIKT